MKLGQVIPTAPEVLREAVIVLAGALLAAAVVGMLPGVKQWMKDQWAGSNPSV